jgi:ribonuclease G
VYTPERDRIAVSRLIEDEDERERLTGLMEGLAEPGEGFILRTAAEGVGEDDLAADAEHLRVLWDGVAETREAADVPGLVHADLGPVQRILRDYAGGGALDAIRIDSPAALAEARTFCERFIPEAVPNIVAHDGEAPLFELFGIEADIETALVSHVGLLSGAGIVIESTEALTAIDVNSGSFTGGSRPEENALRSNLDAAPEIARQIRLRNIGGLIVIDFIHMEEEENWDHVLDVLDDGLARDRMPNRIVGRTPAGLVEVTRRRRRESLAQTLTAPCGGCEGAGRVKTLETLGFEVLRALRREAAHHAGGALVVTAAGDMVEHLETAGKDGLSAISAALGRQITLRAEPGYGRENFDIVVE